MVLRNHGIVCCGETVEEAFDLAFWTVKACEQQVRKILLSSPPDAIGMINYQD